MATLADYYTRVVKFIDRKYEWNGGFQGLGGGGNGELFNGYSVQVLQDEFWRLVTQQCERA